MLSSLNVLIFPEQFTSLIFFIFFILSFLHVIPECILPKSHDYTLTDLISTIHLYNKSFHVKIETVGGKACFTNGIDVIMISLMLLNKKVDFIFVLFVPLVNIL
ncbi:hypothetical protein Hanom_Chr07g00585831 [Helianthus anomalus]